MLHLNLNCWFCNQNSKISIFQRNSWTCHNCGQYNGFNRDGDYNKELPEMYSSENLYYKYARNERRVNETKELSARNALCDRCNFSQKIKIDKLASFKPKNENTYDLEIRMYKEALEKLYELCGVCQSRVKFEITKQDGILKQYLYRIGKFSYLFENPREDHAAKTRTASTSTSTNTFASRAFLFSIYALLVLATVSIQLNNNYLEIEKPTRLVDRFERHIAIKFKKLKDLTSLNTSRLNVQVPFMLLVVYLLICFLMMTRNLRDRCSFIACHLGLPVIWLLATILIFFNYDEFYNYLSMSRLNQMTHVYSFKYAYLLVTSIQVILATCSLVHMLDWLASSKTQRSTQQSNCLQQPHNDINNVNLLRRSQSSEISSLLRPSKLSNSAHANYVNTARFHRSNSFLPTLAECDENDTSSSIVSGLTNLYLTRNMEPDNMSKLIKPNKKLESASFCQPDHYSFYQTHFSTITNQSCRTPADQAQPKTSHGQPNMDLSPKVSYVSPITFVSLITNVAILSLLSYKWYLNDFSFIFTK